MIIHSPKITGSLAFPREDGTEVVLQISTGGELETIEKDSSGNQTSTKPSTNLSGSFTGSFLGDGSNLTGVAATSLNIDGFSAGTIAGDDEILFSDTSDSGNEKRGTFVSGINAIGLFSGSSQLTSSFDLKYLEINGDSVVSGSSQIINLVGLDEDNMSSNSNTKFPTQQSVKAYVDSQILTKDNTDEITEGSSNLYFTNERVDDRVNALIVGGTGITATYNDSAGTLTLDGSAQYGDSDVTDHLDSLSVISGSSQVDYDSIQNKLSVGDGGLTQNNFTNTLKSKLDGIESSATADQTGAQIKTALFGEDDTNNLTDTLKSKLDGIESSATADQTGAQIKTALFSESDTNNLTNTLKSKLDGIEGGANVTDSGNVVPILNSNTVISGSSQVNADSITNFDSNVKTKLNAETVISGSSQVTSIGNSQLSNSSITINGSAISLGGSVTTPNDNTQLTTEQVQDIVGGMLGGTETGITVTYQDGTGDIDFVVASQTDENFTTDDHSKLDGIEAGAEVNRTASETRTLLGTGNGNLVPAAGSSGEFLKHDGTFGTPSYTTNTNTQLTQEQVEDFVGGMLDGTETGITVGYDDTNGNIDFVVASQTDNNFTTTLKNKLDGIAASANNYVLPTNLAGDDIDIDTTVLSGATVISDLDINITTNTSGLVTDANGSIATRDLTPGDLGLGNVTNESKSTMFASPTFTGTVGGVTATHVGLGNVTNESKSTMFASPTFTGNPIAPTQDASNSSTRLATTAFVQGRIDDIIGNAGSTLDTLGELSSSLSDDGDALSTLTTTVGTKLAKSSNLSDLADAATARTNLGVDAAGTVNYTLPTNLAGDDIDVDTGALSGATVISDLDINITTDTSGRVTDANGSVSTRNLTASNLGLGNVTNESKSTMFASPTFTGTVDGVTKSHVGLSNVENTALSTYTGNGGALDNQYIANGAGYITSFTNTNQLTTFQVEDGDGTEVTISHGKEWKFVEGTGIDINWTDTSSGTDGDPYDLTITNTAPFTGDVFDEDGTYTSLRAQGTTKGDVGLGNVTNESKSTMFASPTFTGTVGGVTATHVGLGNVTNESKSTMFASPTFTGTVAGVTKSHVGLGSVENTALSTYTGNGGALDNQYITNGANYISSFDITTQTDSKYLRSNATDTASGVITFSNSTASTSKTTGAVIVTGGVGISGALNVGGDVVAYASSDERLKNNIELISNPIEKVQSLKGVTWDWNENADELQQSLPNVGVIAQDVEKILPQLVTDRDNGFKGVDYAKLTGLLIEAIKEQQKQIDELKSKIG